MNQVIVRTYSAGVHYGTLLSRAGKVVKLKGAKRIWSWTGANTLHEISLHGVGSGSKVSEEVEEITLTEAIEVIKCTTEAVKCFAGQKWGSK